MKPIKNFFKLFLEMFAWIFVIAVISLIIIRVLEKFIVVSDFQQECIMYAVIMLCTVFAPKFRKLILGKYTTTTSLDTDITTDDSKQKGGQPYGCYFIMSKVSMLTVIPHNKAVELLQNRSLHEFNTMPQIDQRVRKVIREFMSENVGYSELPIACFGKSDAKHNVAAEDIMHVLPVNVKNDIIFQLDMPSDMVVSVDFNKLMQASTDVKNAVDEDDAQFVLDEFKDELQLGNNPSTTSVIFIPFLDLDRCRFYAKFNNDFGAEDIDFPTIEKMDVRKITAFL